jgi:serine/threonine protein phosphatase 1
MPEQTIFAVLAADRRNWAVASVHGESERLAALHERLAERIDPSDNLVYLGNFLGRGGDVSATVEELLLFRRALMAEQVTGVAGDIVYLRGSQEEMWHKLLQVQFAPNPRQVFEWMLTQGVGPTLEAYGGVVAEGRRAASSGAVALSQWTNRLRATMRATDGHDRLINVLRRAAYTEDGTLLFVNAGIDPNRPLSEQTDSFWWGGGKFESIEESYSGFSCVVRGFDHHHHGVIVKQHVASIDGGCGFGGPLVAACFDAAGRLIDTIEA